MLTHGLRTLLLAQSSITSLIPSQTVNRITFPGIFCDNAPQGVKPPYVVIHAMATDPMLTLDTYSESLKSDDIEIDVVCYSVPQARSISDTIRQFIDDYNGAAGDNDTIKAVLWNDENYSYDFPDEGRDTKYHIITTSYQIMSAQGA